ncbi:MAG TPA: hypothetical protein VGN64_09200 [Dyadobacter sp.]|jgi:hypothetical protein|nr:hypothetical protein [Dyadobacter sp.]
MKKTQKIIALPVAQKEISEAELNQALVDFAMTSATLVGVNRTHDVLGFLTGLISNSPDMYQKITKPENVERFESIIEKNSGKTPGMMEAIAIMGELKEIFA